MSSNVDSVSFQIKSITDTAGNTEDTLTSFNVDDSQKTVRIDVEKPAVKPGSIGFSTSDTMNDDYDDSSRLLAKNDETIYLDFETNERIDIDSLTVEINGSPLTSTDITNTNSDGKQWQASFIPTGLSSNVDSVSFQIKSITDTAGNTEDTLTSFNVDDSQKTVRIDVEKPAVVSGSIRFSTFDTMNDDYDDSSRLLAKNDETIYLDFETNERIDIDSLTVEINGSTLTSTDITNTNSDGKQWQASFIPTGLSSNVDSVSFQIKSITDTAGNTEDTLTSFNVDDSQKTVRIDVEKPTVVSGSIGFSTFDTMNDDYDDSSRLLAKNDETIYLDFETNERIDIDSLTVEINGSPLTSTDITNTNSDGKQWQASFIPTGLSSNVDSVSFQIKSITDTAGNTEDTLTSFNVDDSQKTVRIDVEKPAVKPGSIRFSTFDTMNDDYDDSSRLLAKNDETIYLDFETNERIDIDSLTVEINGSPLTSTDITNTNSDGKQWQASFIPTGLSSNVDSVSFQIKSITDTAGNTEDTLTSFNVDDSQKTVRIDVEKPAVKPGSIRFSTFDTMNDDYDDSLRLLAKNDETIYLDFETNERIDIDSLTVEINGPADFNGHNLGW